MTRAHNFLAIPWLASAAAESGYLGRQVCAICHASIAASQVKTRMACTWQGTKTKLLPLNYAATHNEGPDPALGCLISRNAKDFSSSSTSWRKSVAVSHRITLGGDRHGLSFLGFLGDLEAKQLNPAWSTAALKLDPGERGSGNDARPQDRSALIITI